MDTAAQNPVQPGTGYHRQIVGAVMTPPRTKAVEEIVASVRGVPNGERTQTPGLVLLTPDMVVELEEQLRYAKVPVATEPKPVCYYYHLGGGNYNLIPDPSSLEIFTKFLGLYRLTPGQGVNSERMVQLIDDLGTAGWDVKPGRPPKIGKPPIRPIEDIASQG